MRRTSSSLALLFAASLGASAVANQATPAATPLAIQAKALDTRPESPAEGRDALDAAVAAAVVGALSGQFSGRTVAVKLDNVDVQPASVRDRVVQGEGRLQLGGGEEWIGFRFRSLYDTASGSATYPDITLGGQPGGDLVVENDSALVRQLDDSVSQRLGDEFGNQDVQLQLDQVTTAEAGKRYLRLSGSGIVDFGSEGKTPAQVEALYDRHDGSWLRVDYELGSTANWDVDSALAGGG